MSETTTLPSEIEALLDKLAPMEPAEAPEEKDEKDPAKIRGVKPPSRGLCRRCGENKPINRLMLCYPCWVKTNLEENGWREGLPHPDSCGCETGEHARQSSGN